MARAKKKKKKRLAHILFAEIVVLLLLIGAVNVYSALNKIQHNSSEDENIEQNEIEEKEGFRNIAIFGVDSRENALIKGTHTDTIIVASINNKTKDVKLTSIYRDTYVNIPEKGYDKINAAYFKGGYSLALSTINTNFDLDVKEYVTVNFKAVVNTIDRLGGITLDISKEELKWLNGYVRELNRINGTNVPGLTSAGTQTVNGTQATAYARIRYTAGGDYKRTERQRIVISKIFEKVKKSDLATINSLIDDIFPQISTNLTSLELLGLAKDVFSYNIVDQTGFPFEKDAHNYKRVSYVFPINLQDNVIRLHEFLFDETGYLPTQTVQGYSTYIESIRVQ
jgi:LCP family protein required for cell wall assembly